MVGATSCNLGTTHTYNADCSNSCATSQQSSAGPSSCNSIITGTGNQTSTVTVSFDLSALSNDGCSGFICSSASGGEEAAYLFGFDAPESSNNPNAGHYSSWSRSVTPDGYNATWVLDVFAKCGNGSVESGEQCDDGNTTNGDCCNSACQYEASGSSCSDGLFCNGTDTCNGAGTCSGHAGDPCPGPDTDANCAEVCNETTDTCSNNDPNGSPCNDGLFCTVTDTCSNGACVGAGYPCPGPDGDGNCAESCNEGANNCTANDTDGSACSDGAFCDGTETCTSGVCGSSTGYPCTGADGDGNCSESCDETADNCLGADPDASPCNDGLFCTQTDACSGGVCSGSGDPCASGTECANACNEAASNCFDLNGSLCTDDGNDCTDDQCDGAGACGHPNKASGVACGDTTTTACTNPDTCDGVGTCQANHAAAGTFCGDSQSCTGNIRTNQDTCDGLGICTNNGIVSCSPFACDPLGTDCLIGCANDSECTTGYFCFSASCVLRSACAAAPITGCKESTIEKGSVLVVKIKSSKPTRDRLVWRLRRGELTTASELGNPFAGPTTYAFCVYDGNNNLIYNGSLPFAQTCGLRSCWRTLLRTTGIRYKDRDRLEEGAVAIKIRAKEAGRSTVAYVATNKNGTLLDDGQGNGLLALPPYANLPIRAQLVNQPEGTCWEATFDSAHVVRNDAIKFKAKSAAPTP